MHARHEFENSRMVLEESVGIIQYAKLKDADVLTLMYQTLIYINHVMEEDKVTQAESFFKNNKEKLHRQKIGYTAVLLGIEIGNYHAHKGNKLKSEEYHNDALSIASKIYGDNSREYLSAKSEKAKSMLNFTPRQSLDKLAKIFNESLELVGAKDAITSSVLLSISRMNLQLNHLSDLPEMYEKMRNVETHNSESDQIFEARRLEIAAIIEFLMDNNAEARRIIRSAISVYSEVYSEDGLKSTRRTEEMIIAAEGG